MVSQRKSIEFSMEANFQQKVVIIAYCFQGLKFLNNNSLGTKRKYALYSIKEFWRKNFVLHLLCSNIPKHFLDDNSLSSNLYMYCLVQNMNWHAITFFFLELSEIPYLNSILFNFLTFAGLVQDCTIFERISVVSRP